MTDRVASQTSSPDLAIPSVLLMRDGRPRLAPMCVPELTLPAIADILVERDPGQRSSGRSTNGQSPSEISLAGELDALRVERMELESQLPELRSNRAALRDELAGLRWRIRQARQERDDLVALAQMQREQVAEWAPGPEEDDYEEVAALRREVQALRRRNFELEGPPAGFRIPIEMLRIGFWTGKQRFDDS